jgi:hypothetical protein
MSKVVLKIISNYASPDKFDEVQHTLENEYFKDIKLLIDDYIVKYPTIR